MGGGVVMTDKSLAAIRENCNVLGMGVAVSVSESTVVRNCFNFSFAATPTRDDVELFFDSRAAANPGARNLPGTRDAAVDKLIVAVGEAKDRNSLIVALRALDRVLRARLDWIPNWYAPNHRVAYWDMFGFKEPKPDYGFPVEALWWYDEEKAKAIGK